MDSSAPRAFIVKPLAAFNRREAACALLALGAFNLVFAGAQPPQASAVSGNALALTTGLSDVAGQHAFLAINRLSAKHAVDGLSEKAFGARQRAINQLERKSFLSAGLGAKPTAPAFEVRAVAVEKSSTGFADERFPSALLPADQAFAFSFTEAFARTGDKPRTSAFSVCESGREAAEGLLTVDAGRFDLRHVTPLLLNQREFGEPQNRNVSFFWNSGNTEPSRACSLRVRGAEGVTTRFKGNSEPTSALRRSNDEEIVWTLPSAVRGKEADHKQVGDNTIDSGFDTLNIQAVDVLTAAEYPWRQAAENVAISGLEIRTNSGESRIVNFVKAKIRNAQNSFRNNMSSDIYSDGTASNQINGLQALVSDAGTGTVGGINSSTFTFWKSQLQSAASPLQGGGAITPSATTIESLMLPLWIKLTRGSDMPDLIVADPIYFSYYEQSQTSLKRYAPEDTGKGGMISMKYKTADVFFDAASLIPASHMYFLNTDYLELVVHKDANMTMMDELRSINQDAVVTPILWMGNAVCSARFLQGVMKA